MGDPAERRPAQGRRRRRRRALPRSRPAMALGALAAAVIVVLLLLGVTRARPGRDVPAYEPEVTTTTIAGGPVSAPEITAKTAVRPVRMTTTTRHR